MNLNETISHEDSLIFIVNEFHRVISIWASQGVHLHDENLKKSLLSFPNKKNSLFD